MGGSVLRIGTRRSPLAWVQAQAVAEALQARGHAVELVGITAAGDRAAEVGDAPPPGRGVFVKELEQALCQGAVDLCVHSAKDVPPDLAPGTVLAAFPRRADPRDTLIAADQAPLRGLPAGARVATGSPRRALQIRALRPDLAVVAVRGNVDTRLRRQQAGEFGALVLAVAGLQRLGLPLGAPLDPAQVVPAGGQGALAIQCRATDWRVRQAVEAVDDPATAFAVEAERAVLASLGGGCRAPVGVLVRVRGKSAWAVAALGGSRSGRVRRVRVQAPGPRAERDREGAQALAQRVVSALLAEEGQELWAEGTEPMA